ncbi:MAG: MATE family efflux transporter [Bacteroidales bacterium]|nr:MATE family efflux transporter [Bacteroidales bacterium]
MLSSSNKRIAKNTVLLYVRILFSQLIALYTSRKVLEILGVEDFGIYGVVGGVASMLTFLNGTMAAATSRYLAIELGKNDLKAYNRVFSMAVIIHIVLASIIFIGGETFGLWFLNHHLVIPESRLYAANIVYQTIILTMVVGIVQTPYLASITTYEHMNIYAYVGMASSLWNLVLVFILAFITGVDSLVCYGILCMVGSLAWAIIYRIYCLRHFSACRFHWKWDTSLFRSMLSFSGWNMLGALSATFRGQGVAIVVNLFGGPVVNASMAVANQVKGAVTGLVGGFSGAISPQITKNYGAQDYQRLHRLILTGSKLQYYLLLILAVPVMLEVPYLLSIWLVEVPQLSIPFVRIGMWDCLIGCLAGPLVTGLLANGNIKVYQIFIGVMLMLNLPISYAFLRWTDCNITIVSVVSVVISVCAVLGRMVFARKMIKLSFWLYARQVILPILMVSALSMLIPSFLHSLLPENFIRLVIVSLSSLLFTSSIIYLLGLTSDEKAIVKTLLQSVLSRFKLKSVQTSEA